MELNFHDQLLLTLVDKTLIGGLIGLGGFWLNRYLEAFKSRQELEKERWKVRDQKRLEIIEAQLSKFYWPIFLHLQMDNVLWERILQRKSEDPIKRSLAAEIEANFILPNHEETSKLIQSNIHLVASDKKILEALVRYVRHVAVYKALRSSGNRDRDPISVEEPWPTDVFKLVKDATDAKQKEFDEMLQQKSAEWTRK